MAERGVEKTFVPGSEWLYYKLYCGVKTADDLLIKLIKPLVREFLNEQSIDKWFFIRYSDPEPHLRFRMHILDLEKLGHVILKTKEYCTPFIDSNQIWDLQLATYQRELKRYGKNAIEAAETFFYYDSEQVLKCIESTKINDEERFYQVYKEIEQNIKLFEFSQEKVLVFLRKNELAFKREFQIDSQSKKILGKKYREFRKRVTHCELKENLSSKELKKNDAACYLKIYQQLNQEIDLERILASLIHMTINRSFRSDQRLQEMVIYDFLFKHYTSTYARIKKQN
jgi:thiopeptide-type bacteriocin biosynthesis protein